MVRPIWISMKQEMMGWQWHQTAIYKSFALCTSLQTDNHASTSSLNFFTGRMLFMTPNQKCQRTEGIKFSKTSRTIAKSTNFFAIFWAVIYEQ